MKDLTLPQRVCVNGGGRGSTSAAGGRPQDFVNQAGGGV